MSVMGMSAYYGTAVAQAGGMHVGKGKSYNRVCWKATLVLHLQPVLPIKIVFSVRLFVYY